MLAHLVRFAASFLVVSISISFAHAQDPLAGRWRLEGTYTDGRRAAADLSVSGAGTRLAFVRTVVGGRPGAWRSSRVAVNGSRADVTYAVPAEPGRSFLDFLLGRPDRPRTN